MLANTNVYAKLFTSLKFILLQAYENKFWKPENQEMPHGNRCSFHPCRLKQPKNKIDCSHETSIVIIKMAVWKIFLAALLTVASVFDVAQTLKSVRQPCMNKQG